MAKEEKIIKTTERVEVIATEKAKHMKDGAHYMVHPHQADRFVKAGWATLASEDSKPSKKK